MEITTREGQSFTIDGPTHSGRIYPWQEAAWSAALQGGYAALGGAWIYYDPWRREIVDSRTGRALPMEQSGSSGIGVVQPGACGRTKIQWRTEGRLVRSYSSEEWDENGVRIEG